MGSVPQLLDVIKELSFLAVADGPRQSTAASASGFCKDLQGMRQQAAFVTSKGYIGWARRGLQKGDRVCVLPTCLMPVLLRKVDSHFIHLGVCYVEGLMNGEAISCWRDGTAPMETFDID